MIGNGYCEPRIIPVGDELPPMEPRSERTRKPTRGTARKPKGKTGERFRVLNNFVDFTLAQLNRAEIAVWLILYRDTRDGIAQTGMTDLARRAGCNRSTVFRALKRLEQIGLLHVVYRGGIGKGVSRYRVNPLLKNA